MKNSHHSSETDNWGTPPYIIKLMHEVMGTPDLDPASSFEHNKHIGAARIITKEEGGIATPWTTGSKSISIFCNPPGGKIGSTSISKMFWQKLMEVREADLLIEAIFVCFSIEALQTTQLSCVHAVTDFTMCIPRRRIHFVGENGARSQPTHANAIVYVPGELDNSQVFVDAFSTIGNCMEPYRATALQMEY